MLADFTFLGLVIAAVFGGVAMTVRRFRDREQQFTLGLDELAAAEIAALLGRRAPAQLHQAGEPVS